MELQLNLCISNLIRVSANTQQNQVIGIQSMKRPPGRKAGVKNKMSATARENVIAVFTRIGGTAHMAEWARENPSDFYRMYSRMIPQEVKATIDPDANTINVAVSFIDPSRDKPGH